jgi:hypothetical protein
MSTEEWEVGEILTNEVLGTRAHYRVVEAREDTILVEVLHAPGLERGVQFAMTVAAAAAMRAADSPQVAEVPKTARRPRLGRRQRESG